MEEGAEWLAALLSTKPRKDNEIYIILRETWRWNQMGKRAQILDHLWPCLVQAISSWRSQRSPNMLHAEAGPFWFSVRANPFWSWTGMIPAWTEGSLHERPLNKGTLSNLIRCHLIPASLYNAPASMLELTLNKRAWYKLGSFVHLDCISQDSPETKVYRKLSNLNSWSSIPHYANSKMQFAILRRF